MDQHDEQLLTDSTMPADYITKAELARRMNKTTRTIENWQSRGILPFIKAGHSVLFHWSEVQTHLRKHFHILRGATAPKQSKQEEQFRVSNSTKGLRLFGRQNKTNKERQTNEQPGSAKQKGRRFQAASRRHPSRGVRGCDESRSDGDRFGGLPSARP